MSVIDTKIFLLQITKNELNLFNIFGNHISEWLDYPKPVMIYNGEYSVKYYILCFGNTRMMIF